MTMVGADPDQLRQLGQLMKDKSRLFEQAAVETTAALGRGAWRGADADRFRAEWNTDLRGRLTSVGLQLSTAADTLKKEAEEQERASEAGGSSAAGGVGSGGAGGTSGSGASGCINDCDIWGLSDINEVLGSSVVEWGSLGGSAAVMGAQLLSNGLTAAGNFMTSAGMVSAVAGTLPMDEFGNVLATAGAYGTAGSRLASAASIGGKIFGGLGVATNALSFAQNIACGDGWGAADNVIGGGLAVAGLIVGMATPVGWAVAGAGLLWGAATLLSGDVPVTERVAGWVSGGASWVGSWFD